MNRPPRLSALTGDRLNYLKNPGRTRRLHLVAGLGLVMLTGCGGSGGGPSGSGNSNPPPPPIANASPGGLWRGMSAVEGIDYTLAIVDESGDFDLLQPADDTQYVGHLTVSGNRASGSFEGSTDFGRGTFADGSRHGTGTLQATVQERVALSLNTSFKTDLGEVDISTLNLSFDPLYYRPSSLAAFAGNFETGTGVVVNVNADGAMFSQDQNTGCVMNGRISIIDAAYNVYRVNLSYANCRGSAAALNDLAFSGLATLDNHQAPETAYVGVTAYSDSQKIAQVLQLSPM